jgi:hypothetical protein
VSASWTSNIGRSATWIAAVGNSSPRGRAEHDPAGLPSKQVSIVDRSRFHDRENSEGLCRRLVAGARFDRDLKCRC